MNSQLEKELPLAHFWAKNKNNIWLTSSFKLSRNLKTHLFPHKLSPSFLKDLTKMLKEPLLKSSLFKKGFFYSMKDLKSDDFQLLYEYFIPKKDYRAYREEQGLIISPNHRYHALINAEDHLTIHYVDSQNQLEKGLKLLLNYESELSKEIEFAFSPKYGFLTSSLKNCGTALEISALLHLPALIHTDTFYEHLGTINSSSFETTSFLGEPDSFLGDLVTLSNKQKINLSEEQLIKSLHSGVLDLVIAEKNVRKKNLEKEKSPLKNKISKAYGTLKHACELDIKEALSLLSLCKLGVELGWIKNISLEKMNELFFSIRKAFLQQLNSSNESLSEFRASHIKKILKSAKI